MTLKTAPRTTTQITGRIDAKFREQPGMRLTDAQVRRLCHLSEDQCHAALEEMVDRGTLVREQSGQYRSRTGE
jgi:hypothetical protein